MGRLQPILWGGVTAAMLAAGPALAHPHVFVDAKAEVVFSTPGTITAIRNIWQFDRAFSEYAIQGLDANDDGQLSDAELKPLAKVNVEALSEFEFFNFLILGDRKFEFVPPTEYWLEFRGGRLTLFYTLPLKQPRTRRSRSPGTRAAVRPPIMSRTSSISRPWPHFRRSRKTSANCRRNLKTQRLGLRTPSR
jgi:ABC-type uncharacterized transport system substrate-binding protein